MRFVRKLLLSTLGEKRYLWLLANSFQWLYKTGRLGVDYQDIYFLKNLIRPGDQCIDVGAHLGYFTFELSRLTGSNGHVYAIEPMSKFYQTLQALLKKKKAKNVTLEQYAMGASEEFVEMGIPKVNNVKKFAYARAVQYNTFLEYVESEKVRNLHGDEHFGHLQQVDFIKCDVEGLELAVFQSFLEIIRKHRPIILCELGDPAERVRLLELLQGNAYGIYYLEYKKLKPMEPDSPVKTISHNHYFIPASRIDALQWAMDS
ncbi:MAG: FkbM family methyltransferase [Bacteroidota bacterium]|nr:FkbM family methyltransferase [Bacteroidota bacterium]MDP4211231.1 FkbM family methyltransferase [Bacteroidota bacterium]MDP4251139.1 FkbM family methyltransferase [Bacteroidota bacterium]